MNPVSILLSILLISFSTAQPEPVSMNSLTLKLIHRNQLHHTTEKKRTTHRLLRDSLRVNALSSSAHQSVSGPLSYGLALDGMDYVVSLDVGTPHQQVYLALDTRSSVVWLQCLPCKNCYKQSDPIFSPNNSNSFFPLPCTDDACKQLKNSKSSVCGSSNKNPCLYNLDYTDDWFTSGQFSTETLTFGNNAVEKVALGCGHNNSNPLDKSAGLLALGRGDVSFATQMGKRFGRKFSYCLLYSPSNSSSIIFGDSAVPPNANLTSLLSNPVYDGYYVGLLGFSVGGKSVSGIDPSVFQMRGDDGTGGVVVDTLASFTWLPKRAYESLRDAFRQAFNNYTNLMIGTGTAHFNLDTCYNLTGIEDSVSVPKVELHFEGADVELPDGNSFPLMDNNGIYCLAFRDNGFPSVDRLGQKSTRLHI